MFYFGIPFLKGQELLGDQGDNSPPLSNHYIYPTAHSSSLPTDVAALHSIINTIQAQLQATTTSTPAGFTPTTSVTPTTTNTPAPVPCPAPNQPLGTASGRGAASPEVFKEIIKINWHGRLGRAHMMDVDALPPAALMELDGIMRRKLRGLFPCGVGCTYSINADETFAGLAALGLRLENRDRYMCQILGDNTLLKDSTTKRARDLAAYY
ncbi:hypothetical protein DFP73DRAFT_591492 [Morchella snyderi]|nr:hypothetical protein DFP73DRAFT_591492 [Morchella snyderi]